MKRLAAIGTAAALFVISCIVPGIEGFASSYEEGTGEVTDVLEGTELPETDIQENMEEGTDGSADEQPAEDVETDSTDQTDTAENGTGDTGMEEEIIVQETQDEPMPSVSYSTHVQTIGWQDYVKDGEMAGTQSRALRMEGIRINLENTGETQGSIEYQAHVQSIGWQDYVGAGELAGTTARKLRVEAVRIRLTGELAEKYDIYYRTHIQSYGWLNWAKNGEGSGSMGFSKRMEAVEICLVRKGEQPPVKEGNSSSYIYRRIAYQAHSQSFGWRGTVYDDAEGGVTGMGKRLEAFKISLPEQEYPGDIEYRAYVQTYGWQEWKRNGEEIGTTGQGKRIEALEIRLTGELAQHYSVYYSVHMAKIGWTNYAKDGETAGSMELGKRVEAVKIRLVKEGETAPPVDGVKFIRGLSKTDFYYNGIIQDQGKSGDAVNGTMLGTTGQGKRLESLAIFVNNQEAGYPQGGVNYAVHLSGLGWQSETGTGTENGCTDGTHGIEAVKISLTGDLAKYYDIYYSTHIQKFGWLGWAKNGQEAGSTGNGYRMEALEIHLVSKDMKAPGPNSNYFTDRKFRRYQNPEQYYQIKDKITLTGGGYNLSYGFEGIKVRKVIQRLGLGSGVGMGGAFYGTSVQNAVRSFQRNSGLSQTGTVDLLTWLRMGFSQSEWESYGAYVSPLRVNENSSRSDHIEAMIGRAYDYYGDDYVIGASGAPGLGIDCSGLVMQALYAAGLDLSPITPVSHAQPGHEYESRNMWASSRFLHVPYSERQRGDLIFYQSSSGVVIHVAIYLGNDQVIEAWPNKVVVWPIQNGSRSNIKGVVRPFV